MFFVNYLQDTTHVEWQEESCILATVVLAW